MSNMRYYCVNDLCWVACDVDSIVGRGVDLHLKYFKREDPPHNHKADIVFHPKLPEPSPDCVVTADGLMVDGSTAFMPDKHVAIRYGESRLDVYSTRGVAPPFFIQLLGVIRNFCLVHCAGISYKKQGILLPALGGVGKTSLVVNVLADDGVQFFGDDFVFLCGHRGIVKYPIPFAVYNYHRKLFPQLFSERSKRRRIASKPLLSVLRTVRPLAKVVLEKYPRLEEIAKPFGRGYRPVPVLEIFPAEKIGVDAPIAKVVCLARYRGNDFELQDIDREQVIRRVLGTVHYEYAGSSSMSYLLTMAAFGKLNIADYFNRLRNIVTEAIGQAKCQVLMIPNSAPAQGIGDAFRIKVLKDID